MGVPLQNGVADPSSVAQAMTLGQELQLKLQQIPQAEFRGAPGWTALGRSQRREFNNREINRQAELAKLSYELARVDREEKRQSENTAYERGRNIREDATKRRDRIAGDRDKHVDGYQKATQALYQAQLGMGAVAHLPEDDVARVMATNYYNEIVTSQQDFRRLATYDEQQLQDIDETLTSISMMQPPEAAGKGGGEAQTPSGGVESSYAQQKYGGGWQRNEPAQDTSSVTNGMSMMQAGSQPSVDDGGPWIAGKEAPAQGAAPTGQPAGQPGSDDGDGSYSMTLQYPPKQPPPGAPTKSDVGFGKRADGSEKGTGWLGVLKRPDGKVSTELSIGVNFDGKDMDIPSLVPGLTKKEVDYLLVGGEPTDEIVQKAVDHARTEIAAGRSPFKDGQANDVAAPPQHPLAREQMLASRAGVSGGEYVNDERGGPGKMVYKVYSDEDELYANKRLETASKAWNFGTPLNAVVINEYARMEKGANKFYELVGKQDKEFGKASTFKRFRAKPPSVTEINQMVATFTSFGDDEGLQNFSAVVNADEKDRAAIVDEIVKDYEKRAKGWDEDIAMWKRDRDDLRKHKGMGVLDDSDRSDDPAASGTAPPPGMTKDEFKEWYVKTAEPGKSKGNKELIEKNNRMQLAWLKYIRGY